MCGITGFLDSRADKSRDDLLAITRAMTACIRHRGPDDSGEFIDAERGVALGFRRLSIIDLSPAGHQPMTSASGRFTVIYNGEVYNFEDIRAELRASGYDKPFRGHSDTEVMLAAFETWGVAEAVKRFIGMFAIALWDRELQLLHLIRDRLGVKPLYYGRSGSTFLFGSELKTFVTHPAFDARIDRDSVSLLLRYGYIPAPFSIYEGVRKLTPGAILTVRAGSEPIESVYWSAVDVAHDGLRNPLRLSEREAEESLNDLLLDAVRYRLVSDVPLGVFLSGGIDSSTVVALMQAQSSQPVKTFTIGFHEGGFDEAQHAKAVAHHLGTDHTELYITPAEALAVIPKLPHLYDEPFADPSQIPTHLVSALARRDVTVALSGDGGDELFGGYRRYFLGARAWRSLSWIPAGVRAAGGRVLGSVRPDTWDRLFSVLPQRVRPGSGGDKVAKAAAVIGSRNAEDVYRRLLTQWPSAENVVIGAGDRDSAVWSDPRIEAISDFTSRMMLLDTLTYLPDDILTKVDRASMGVSLEAREPLLDHRVVEFAWRLPMDMKVRSGQGKWLLRRVLSRYVPDALTDRPKMGFGVPIDNWLRGPLREWAEALLDESRLRREGMFDPAPVRQRWNEHLSGRRNWQYALWTVLMFQLWLEQQTSSVKSGMPAAVAHQ